MIFILEIESSICQHDGWGITGFYRQGAVFYMFNNEQGRLILPPTELLYIIILMSTCSLLSSFLLQMHTQHYLSLFNINGLLEQQFEAQSKACHICIQVFISRIHNFEKKVYLSWYLSKCNITTVCFYGCRIYSDSVYVSNIFSKKIPGLLNLLYNEVKVLFKKLLK